MSKSTKNENKERNSKNFQTHSIDHEIFDLEVKARNSPFNCLNPGTLEIAFNSKIHMTMSLTSSSCEEKKRIATNSWKGNLELCLKYTDKEWKYQEQIKHKQLSRETIIYFNPDEHRFSVTINITKFETDVNFRTSPAVCTAEIIHVWSRIAQVNQTAQALKIREKVDRDNGSDGRDEWGPLPVAQETVHEYPNIAVIGSGGGMRAVIGMSGAMVGLQTTGILDKTVYTAGVSGSAWYLLTLYSGLDGTVNPNKVNLQIEKNIKMFRKVCVAWNLFKYFLMKITGRSEKFFTFTNTFGEMIGSLLLNWNIQRLHTWSTQFNEVDACLIPFPMVAALHVIDETTIKEYHEWVEITPYELCILEYGVAIETADFGKEFEYGLLKCTRERLIRQSERQIKQLLLQPMVDPNELIILREKLEKLLFKHPHELPIHFLQGICGSAYAIVREYRLKDHRNQQHVQELQDSKWYQPWRYVRHLIGNWLGYVRDLIWKMFNLFDSLFIAKVPNFLKGMQLKKKDPPHDVIELKNDYLMLVDAGLSFNSPYPLVLHPSREVDFIISFDWSDRGQDAARPFGELIEAEKWAHNHGVPFPSIEKKIVMIEEEWDAGIVKDMYIFEDVGAPTIVHFVMIDISGDLRIHSDYGTLKFSYTAKEFTDFNDLARRMVENNEPAITDCIRRHMRISRRDQ